MTAPLALMAAPGDASGRLFVVDQAGVVRVISAQGTLLPAPFVDVRGSMVPLNADYDERGLLGLAFHPGFSTTGRFFVFYTAPGPAGSDHANVVAEFRVSAADPDVADPTETVVLRVDHPQANHNGGALAFGPDGFLYVSIGDGGAPTTSDPVTSPAATPRASTTSSGRSSGSTSIRRGRARRTPSRPTTPSRARSPAGTRSSPSACATPTASPSIVAGAVSSSPATRGRTSGKRST